MSHELGPGCVLDLPDAARRAATTLTPEVERDLAVRCRAGDRDAGRRSSRRACPS